MKRIILFTLLISSGNRLIAQTQTPDLQDQTKWQAVNRIAVPIDENGKKGVTLDGLPGDGLYLLKGSSFSNGVIEFDVRGKNLVGQSFVGFAFHVQNENSYDAVYFRPFNFMNPDTVRRSRAVQYVWMPAYPWEKLRAEFPGKYENKVNPVPDPDGWFHVKIMVAEKTVKVFVNNSPKPSLEIARLNDTHNGQLGFWVGNNSSGSFANLVITPPKP
jgi:hypothetical protein